MATTSTLISIEEYLHTTYKPDVDFIDGELQERFMGEHSHNFLQGLVYSVFSSNSDVWNTEPITEQRIRFGSSGIRVCDIAVLHADASFEEVVTTPPLICIEIMSPSDRLSRATPVLVDYFSMGVANIWLIDPLRRCAYTYDARGLQLAESPVLAVAGTAIRLDTAGMFDKLDKKIAQTKRL